MNRKNIVGQALKNIGLVCAFSATVAMSGTSYAAALDSAGGSLYRSELMHVSHNDKAVDVRHRGATNSVPEAAKVKPKPKVANTHAPLKSKTHTDSISTEPSIVNVPSRTADEQREADAQLAKLKIEQDKLKIKVAKVAEQEKVANAKASGTETEKKGAEKLLNAVKQKKEEVQNEQMIIEQKVNTLLEIDTIFDGSLMDVVYAKATGWPQDTYTDHSYNRRVVKAFLNLYNRLPYHNQKIRREDQGGDIAVPYLRKNVEFSKLPVFSGHLDQQPNPSPVLGIRFKVEVNGQTCGAGPGFDGYFQFAASDSAGNGSKGWVASLSKKDVFAQGTDVVINQCLKRAADTETWGQYFTSYFGGGFSTAFSSDVIPVKDITPKKYSWIKGELSIQQIEDILLLVRNRVVPTRRPGESPYSLVLGMDESEHENFLKRLRSLKPTEVRTAVDAKKKMISTDDFGL